MKKSLLGSLHLIFFVLLIMLMPISVLAEAETHNHSFDKKVVNPASFEASGKVVMVCECGEEKTIETIPQISSIKLSKESAIYSGKILAMPGIKILDSENGEIDSQYYDIIRPKTIQGVGVYNFIIEFRGNYSGKETVQYRVFPKKPVIKSIKAGKKSITITLKNKATATGGDAYTIAYRQKGSKKWKTVSTKKNTVTIKKLKKGKRYEVKAFASKRKSLCSDWTKVKVSKAVY